MRYLEEIYHIFKQSEKLANKKQRYIAYTVSSLLLMATAAMMSVMNIRRGLYVMAAITVAITIILLLCAYLFGVRKMEILPSTLAAACIILTFSYFAVSGQNEGFAILWILLIPLFSTSLFEVRIGVGVSVYFLIFCFVLFFTPLNVYVVDSYTESFISRFPVLYFCTFLVSMFIFLQKEMYSRKLYLQSNWDALTETYNRNYFTHSVLQMSLSDERNTCVMIIDINGLKEVNDTLGHKAGDELICAVPYSCRRSMESDFTLCRIGGDEFVLVVHRPEKEIAPLAEKIKNVGLNWKGKYSQGCRMAIGWASSREYPQATMDELYRIADIEMYQDKAKYYKQIEKFGRK